jgi:hypothetical protein
MSVWLLDIGGVRPDKREEFERGWKIFLKECDDDPERWKGLKSQKLFKDGFGGVSLFNTAVMNSPTVDTYIMMREFDTLADLEELSFRIWPARWPPGEDGSIPEWEPTGEETILDLFETWTCYVWTDEEYA